ncbi:uncharacterized protein LOC142043385 [Buteo buteo]|uniref:uncharacterized protein LOC142043385 n=1 Tax=Buteo buteo TaxID=30397 RepID=UPI003EB8B626
MPMDEEANARSQPADRLPSLQKRSRVGRQQPEAAPQAGRSRASSLRGDRLPRLESSQATESRHTQTDSLARRVAQPRSRAAREETTRLPALTPLPRPAAAARHAPAARPPGAASACCKLPPLPAAPATSSARGRETGASTAAGGHRRIVPSARGVRGDQGTAARVQVQRPAPLSPTARAAAAKGTAQCLRSKVPGKVAAASRRPSRQPEARRDGAHGTAVATTARTDEAGAADGGAAPTALPALAEEEEREEDSDKELSQGEDFTTNTIWVNPLVPEVFQDPHAGPQEGPSSEGTDAAAEAAGELQSASPAPAGLPDAEPAGPAPDAPPEEEGHHALLAPAAQDEAKKSPASPVFGEQDTAVEAESQAPAPHSSMASTADLQEIANRIVRDVLMKSLAALKIASQQPVEQRDLAHSTDVAMTKTTNEVQATDSGEARTALPALAEEDEWEEDSDKELSQGEDFTTNTIWVNPLVLELFQEPHTGPSSEGGEAAAEVAGELQSASPAPARLPDAEPAGPAPDAAPEEEGHHALLAPAAQDEAKKSPASPVFGEQDTAAEAESQAPAPHSSMASTADLQEIANRIVRDVLMKSLAALKIASQQPVEQRVLAHSTDVAMTETTNEVQATDSGEDEASTALPALAEEEEWEEDSDKELSQGEDFTTNTIWVNPLVLELFQEPHTGHSSTAATADLQEIANRIVRDVLMKSLAVLKIASQQPAAQRDWAQSMDVVMAPRAPAGPQDFESPFEAAASSPLARDPQHQAASEHRGDTQQSSGRSDVPEDDSGIATLPHAPALFRRALRALRRAFCSACVPGQQEQ